MLVKCENCDRVLIYSQHSGDLVHNCNDFPVNTTNAVEDVVNIGNSEEFGTIVNGTKPNEVMTQGIANQLEGTDASIVDHERFSPLTPRGNRVATHRQRDFYNHMELGEKND